jgi:hypothetical protein
MLRSSKLHNEVEIFLKPEIFKSWNRSLENDSYFMKERLDHVARSSLSTLNVSKFGMKLALAEELRDLGDYSEAESKAKEV